MARKNVFWIIVGGMNILTQLRVIILNDPFLWWLNVYDTKEQQSKNKNNIIVMGYYYIFK